MATKVKTLSLIRRTYKRYLATWTKDANLEYLEAKRRFTWTPVEEDDIDVVAKEIDESDFLAEAGEPGGHPMPGTYRVEFYNTTGGGEDEEDEDGGEEVILDGFTLEGEYEDQESNLERVASQSNGESTMRFVAASQRLQMEAVHSDLARLRAAESRQEERIAKVQATLDTQRDALYQAKDDTRKALMERDDMERAALEAIDERDAMSERMAEMVRKGGQFAPVAEVATKAMVDRMLAQLGIENTADDVVALRDAQFELCAAMIARQNLPVMLLLCITDAVPWQPVRILIIEAYGVDPGAVPPEVEWQPPHPGDAANDQRVA